MPYLITGATGPIGRSIVTQLRTLGHDVRIVTRDLDKALLELKRCRAILRKGICPPRLLRG